MQYNEYTYNANGIRTSKTVGSSEHTYILDGTKILREAWNDSQKDHVLVPLYDNEDSVCGIVHGGTPYFFQKNLQGDIIAIVDASGKVVGKYSYDAWGKCTIVYQKSGSTVASANPFRYRGYYFDSETEFYYLQSRYYDPSTGRFINGDEAIYLLTNLNTLNFNIICFCYNNAVNNIDHFGYWAEKYSGFKKTGAGFNVNNNLLFLSRSFCLYYADDIIKMYGNKKYFFSTKKYQNMTSTRIAEELWFHALVYYAGIPLKEFLASRGYSWDKLNGWIDSARYIEVNNNDKRAWVFSMVWSLAKMIYPIIIYTPGYGWLKSYITI